MSQQQLDVLRAPHGAVEDSARLAALLLHGRQESPDQMIALADRIGAPAVAAYALQAPRLSWYPESFLAPLELNRAGLEAAMAQVDRAVGELVARGWKRDRIALIGYSQGAVVASEYLRREGGRWAAALIYTGGLAGPPGVDWGAPVDLAGTPILLSDGDHDPYIPVSRIEETAAWFRACGAEVETRIYPGRAHSVCDDEVAAGRALLDRALERSKLDL